MCPHMTLKDGRNAVAFIENGENGFPSLLCRESGKQCICQIGKGTANLKHPGIVLFLKKSYICDEMFANSTL